MTLGRTGEWPGKTPGRPAWRRYRGPALALITIRLHCQWNAGPAQCCTSLGTLGNWVHLSGAVCGPLLLGLLHQPDDTTHSIWHEVMVRSFIYIKVSYKALIQLTSVYGKRYIDQLYSALLLHYFYVLDKFHARWRYKVRYHMGFKATTSSIETTGLTMHS